METVQFTEQTSILEALESDERVVGTFRRLNLKCVDCIAVFKESLRDAARYHHIDLQTLLKELNKLGVPKR